MSGKTVERVVGFTGSTDGTRDGIGLGLALDDSSVGINIGNVDLDGSMILGIDESAGSRALSRDVQVNDDALVVLHSKINNSKNP